MVYHWSHLNSSDNKGHAKLDGGFPKLVNKMIYVTNLGLIILLVINTFQLKAFQGHAYN